MTPPGAAEGWLVDVALAQFMSRKHGIVPTPPHLSAPWPEDWPESGAAVQIALGDLDVTYTHHDGDDGWRAVWDSLRVSDGDDGSKVVECGGLAVV